MSWREVVDIVTILGQLGMAFLVIPACLVSAGILLIKLVAMLGEEVR